MTRCFLALAVAGILHIASLQNASAAVLIPGKVDMVGTGSLNDSSLIAATGFSSFGPATVIPTPNGAFIGTAGSAVTFTPFMWNPQSTPVVPLWSFVSGGWTYTFELSEITFVSQNAAFVNLAGNGVLNITGLGSPYEATPASWTFTITSAGADLDFRFGFVSSNAAVVPEPSTIVAGALLLLPFGVLTIGRLRNSKQAS